VETNGDESLYLVLFSKAAFYATSSSTASRAKERPDIVAVAAPVKPITNKIKFPHFRTIAMLFFGLKSSSCGITSGGVNYVGHCDHASAHAMRKASSNYRNGKHTRVDVAG
jgi:hypothetical protein